LPIYDCLIGPAVSGGKASRIHYGPTVPGNRLPVSLGNRGKLFVFFRDSTVKVLLCLTQVAIRIQYGLIGHFVGLSAEFT
jgi:hypothetical protein